jgi:hypothetical protein
VKNSFRDILATDRRWQLAKTEFLIKYPPALVDIKRLRPEIRMAAELDLNKSQEIFKAWKSKYAELFPLARQQRTQAIETKRDLEEAFRLAMRGDVKNPLFEFSTPVINDYFQLVGGKLYELTKSAHLQLYVNKPEPATFDEYYALAQSRFANSPNALVTFIIGDICRRQKDNNACARQFARFCIQLLPLEEFLKHEEAHHARLYAALPRGNDLSNYILVMSEKFEAAVWLMFLGDPSGWFAIKDSKTGRHYNVPRSPGYVEYVPGYFKMQRSLPEEIERHLLDTFHPEPKSAKSFRDYYRKLKQVKQLTQTGVPSETGIDRPQGYRWGVPQSGPDAPPEDPTSKSYTAEETALANLQLYFSSLHSAMKSSEGYFSTIMSAHKIQ